MPLRVNLVGIENRKSLFFKDFRNYIEELMSSQIEGIYKNSKDSIFKFFPDNCEYDHSQIHYLFK